MSRASIHRQALNEISNKSICQSALGKGSFPHKLELCLFPAVSLADTPPLAAPHHPLALLGKVFQASREGPHTLLGFLALFSCKSCQFKQFLFLAASTSLLPLCQQWCAKSAAHKIIWKWCQKQMLRCFRRSQPIPREPFTSVHVMWWQCTGSERWNSSLGWVWSVSNSACSGWITQRITAQECLGKKISKKPIFSKQSRRRKNAQK